MTRQTAEPLEHITVNPASRQAREMTRAVERGELLLSPSYQRDDVWTEDQRVAARSRASGAGA